MNARLEYARYIVARDNLQDPLSRASRARVEAATAKNKRARGRYRVLILGTYQVARSNDLDTLKAIANVYRNDIGNGKIVELIDTVEFNFIPY
jgi:hypothetical protein